MRISPQLRTIPPQCGGPTGNHNILQPQAVPSWNVPNHWRNHEKDTSSAAALRLTSNETNLAIQFF